MLHSFCSWAGPTLERHPSPIQKIYIRSGTLFFPEGRTRLQLSDASFVEPSCRISARIDLFVPPFRSAEIDVDLPTDRYSPRVRIHMRTEATSALDISNFALPSVSLLETVLAPAVVRDGFLDFFAGGHDEWT